MINTVFPSPAADQLDVTILECVSGESSRVFALEADRELKIRGTDGRFAGAKARHTSCHLNMHGIPLA